jgi:hypothetical protein
MLTKLPKEMYAEIARFLGDDFPGKGFRLAAGTVQIRDDINSRTYLNGVLHSFDDQPAVITVLGSRKWYHNGLLHRDNGSPAIMSSDGTREWYTHGKFTCISRNYFY